MPNKKSKSDKAVSLSPDNLLSDVKGLKEALKAEISRRIKAEDEKEALINNSSLYVKELNCLYGLAELINRYNESLEEVCSRVVNLIPPSLQYPEISAVCITLNEKQYKTSDFKITEWREEVPISAFGLCIGMIEVCLLEDRPKKQTSPFLIEERRLMRGIASRLGRAAEHKHMQEALATAKRNLENNYRQLKELESLKDNLTHMIIHDLNNPLGAIIGRLDIMKMQLADKLTESQKDGLDLAILSGSNARRLIADLLDVTKMEDRKIELIYRSCDLEEIVRGVIREAKVLAQLEEKSLSCEAHGHIPKAVIDKDMIKRVMANLITNAMKFTPAKGFVKVDISFDDSHRDFIIKVIDNGRGIPKEYLGKIFEKFVQVGTTKTRSGFGLGLTFCKMAVDLHGGMIWAESEEGKGSTFIFTVPLREDVEK